MKEKIKEELNRIENEINSLNIRKEALIWTLNLDKEQSGLINKSETYPVKGNLVDKDFIDLGEEVTIHHDDLGDIKFIVIGTDHDSPNSITLLSKHIQRRFEFNETIMVEGVSGKTPILINRYNNSTIRRWLNSTGDIWYSKEKESDIAPHYTNENPLLKGFDKNLVDNMITVQKELFDVDTNEMNYIIDKVFLLSVKEYGLLNEITCSLNLIDGYTHEGMLYDYFRTETDHNIHQKYWTRTASESAGQVYYIDNTKKYTRIVLANSIDAFNGIRFAFCVPRDFYLKEIKKNEM